MYPSKTAIQSGANPIEPVLQDRLGAIRFFLICGFVGVTVFCLLLGLGDSQAEYPPALDTINPNTDPAASLVRLPGVGLSRALAIVEYRQSHSQNGPAFQTPQDLDAVSGLGPKSIEKMTPWLSIRGNQLSTVENKQ